MNTLLQSNVRVKKLTDFGSTGYFEQKFVRKSAVFVTIFRRSE